MHRQYAPCTNPAQATANIRFIEMSWGRIQFNSFALHTQQPFREQLKYKIRKWVQTLNTLNVNSVNTLHLYFNWDYEWVREALKNNILILTFVNIHFTPSSPLNFDEKPLKFGGPVRCGGWPFIKVKNNIV